MIRLPLALLALLVPLAASAEPLNPARLKHCFAIAEKPEAMKVAHKLGKVQTFNAEQSKAIIDAINIQPPASNWEANVVDVVTTDDAVAPVHVFLTDSKHMCLIETAKQEEWDKLLDQTFGQGT